MQKFHRSFPACVGLAIAAVSLLAGCQILPEAKVDPTRHFVLSGPTPTDSPAAKPAGRFQVGIRSIEMAGYLSNHRDIAVRTGSNEIRFEEFSRWAEPLESGINRVLKQRLLSQDAVAGVSNYPFAADLKRDYDLVIRVLNCEGVQGARGGSARFVATYDILAAGGGGQIVARRTFTAPEQPWDGRDFGALASLLSEAVSKLSEDIATNLPK
ncbi:MAG: PqiC family protein [Nibricoccus sp.]